MSSAGAHRTMFFLLSSLFFVSCWSGAASAEDGLASAWNCLEAGGCQGQDLDLGGGLVLRRSSESLLRQGKNMAEGGEDGGSWFSRMAGLFSGRSLVLQLPVFTGRELQQGFDEGRGKMKKMMGSMMMMGAMKAMMIIPMMLGTLFLLAGKALIIAKVALVLALVITLKKLVAAKQEGGGGHGWSGGDRRSFGAHDLAYSAYLRR